MAPNLRVGGPPRPPTPEESVPIRSVGAPQVKETRGDSLRRCARKESSPTHPPRLLDPFLQEDGLPPSLGLGKLGNERLHLG